MTYVINDNCVMCGTCESSCPVSAITQGESKYEINQTTCIGCGCCAGVCPVNAPQEKY